MFGRRKKVASLTEAQIRDAYIKRLVEVLGFPNIEPAVCEASPQESLKPAPDPVTAFDESFLKLVGISRFQDAPDAKPGISTPK